MKTETGTIRYVHILLQTLKKMGYQRSEFLKSLNIPIDFMDGSKLRLPLHTIAYMWDAARDFTDEPALGLMAGKYIHPADFGIMNHVWMNCDTMMDILQSRCDYNLLMNTALQNELYFDGLNQVHFEMDVRNCPPEARKLLVELDMSSMVMVGKALADPSNRDKVQYESVRFSHAPMTDKRTYERILGCPVEFNAPSNRIIIRREVLDLPTYSPDPSLKTTLISTVEKLLSKTLRKGNISSRVAEQIATSIHNNQPPASLEETARQFNISPSTLKRKIKEEGFTFSAISRQVKMNTAKEMIRGNILSPSQISFALGYSDVTAFHRAFKQWTGTTPEQYRKQYIAKN